MNRPPDIGKLEQPSQLILSNYRRLFGRDLVTPSEAKALFEAPFAVLSALGPFGSDHLFNYANRQALELFQYAWDELMGKPSSASAEPVHRDERRRLLDEVGEHGFIENYSGIRISKNGRRFRIKKATVFNLLDANGNYVGQSATFADWERLD
ncbi:MAG: MEKHLA domain-containing protein [Chthoniobacterales bacterium]